MYAAKLIAVASGGALGAVARYVISYFIQQQDKTILPMATISVNLLGAFLLGFLYGFSIERWTAYPELRSLLSIGFLGAFTTFSTFALEVFELLRLGEYLAAGQTVVASVLLSVALIGLGSYCGRLLFS
jgi:CrcB protein